METIREMEIVFQNGCRLVTTWDNYHHELKYPIISIVDKKGTIMNEIKLAPNTHLSEIRLFAEYVQKVTKCSKSIIRTLLMEQNIG